jgi:hypothetical protein
MLAVYGGIDLGQLIMAPNQLDGGGWKNVSSI